jgi:glycosyltransferase involved in cell wall biosynthesis
MEHLTNAMITDKRYPLVSVITVVYNGEAYIEETLRSVVGQTYPNIEYIVVDGGSSDKTLAIIEKYRSGITHLISEKDRGIYDAMNKGQLAASGEWVSFLNGGDYFFGRDTIREFVEAIPPDAYLVYGDSINVASGFQKLIKPTRVTRSTLRKYLGLCHQAVLVRRKIAPLYDLRYRYKAEYNWIIDIVYSAPPSSIYYVPRSIVYYSLGGFSEKGALKNLLEFISLTKRRFGLIQVLLNSPIYLTVLLRNLKYKYFGYRGKFEP